MDVEKIMNRAYLLALAGAIAAAASLPLEAATYTFTGDGSRQLARRPPSHQRPAAHFIIAPTSTAAITSIPDDAFPSWTINALTFNHTSNIVSIAANGTVSINSLALNGPVAVHTGAILSFANPISGTGSLSRDAGPITFNINGPNAFTGTQLTPAFTRPGDTINLAAGNLVNLSALIPAATYVLSFSGAATQAEDYHLDGGALRIASTYTLVSSTASGIRIGDNGGTLQATGTATITVPITATGTLSIGSAPSDNFGHGFVILKSTNTLPAVVVNNAGLSVGSPATLGTGPITLNSASLQLYPVADANNLALYPNTLTISGDSNLYDFLNPFNLRPGYNTRIAPALSLARVNYQSALTLRISKLTIADLHMTGDGTITSPGGIIVISTLSADASPRTLTLNTTSSRASFQVTDSVAPNLSLTLTNADLLLAAPQDPASVTAFYIATASTLTFATDYDFTTGPTLAGFGHVIIAAGATLTLPIDTAYAGTIQVNGTLVLAPALNPANAHRVPAFFILPTPEPTSLSLLLLASPLLLRRKR